MNATVQRHRAPSGNRDNDYFHAVCPTCGWTGAYHPNRTVEGRRLAERDAAQHRCTVQLTIPARDVRVGDTVLDPAGAYVVRHTMTTGKKAKTTSLADVLYGTHHYAPDQLLQVQRKEQ